MIRRLFYSLLLLLLASIVFGVGRYFNQDTEPLPLYIRFTFLAVAGGLAIMAISVMLLGRIYIWQLLVIDVRSKRARLHIGPPFFRVSMADEPIKGALPILRTGMWLRTPWLVRLTLIIIICSVLFGAIQHQISVLPRFIGISMFGMALVVLDFMLYRWAVRRFAQARPRQATAVSATDDTLKA